jgi:Asp-tRNA(Asn)/Glu-tRNA(Gln) amidotransferase A subunit family amidase
VARLRAAGAAILETNMSEFAFSGVGINPHFGTPRNPHDTALARIPGGSSSGAAVSVALGLAVAALGSDTRQAPSACPRRAVWWASSTQSRVPLQGAFPLSHTLDTVCAMSTCVRDSLLVDGVISGQPLAVRERVLAGARLPCPQAWCSTHSSRPWRRPSARAVGAVGGRRSWWSSRWPSSRRSPTSTPRAASRPWRPGRCTAPTCRRGARASTRAWPCASPWARA